MERIKTSAKVVTLLFQGGQWAVRAKVPIVFGRSGRPWSEEVRREENQVELFGGYVRDSLQKGGRD